MRTRKRVTLLTSVAAIALAASACGGGSGGTEKSGTASESDATGSASATASAAESGDAAASGETKMTITYTLSDAAVWNDGTPITAADFECSWKAITNTPGAAATPGYDEIVSVAPGASDKEVVISLSEVYAPWRELFAPGKVFQASKYEDCNDLSEAFPAEAYNYGAGPYLMTEWTPEQMVYTKNPGYKGKNTGGAESIVFVPAEDGTTLLKAGTVDLIFPQSRTGIDKELADPKVKYETTRYPAYEALYFMQDPACEPDEQRSCAFADPVYREAFFKSIDTDAFYKQIYEPFAQGLPLLTCGPVVPGPYCDENAFKDTYDPEGAAKLLTDAGWTKGGNGMWVNPDGETPEVHWMVNTGNPRRESAQTFMIPKMAAAGFQVKADNCEANPCVFQTRIPNEAYDLAMTINEISPDPGYLANGYTCDQIPSPDNDFQGQNTVGWCNEEADADLKASDQELDEAKRAELIKKGIAAMRTDAVLLPLLQWPVIGAYRTDRVDNALNNLQNFYGFNDWYNFKDVDGDGKIVIGTEQYATPDCANPVTECSTSTWYRVTASFPSFPGVYMTNDDGAYITTEFLAGEAKVETK